MTIKVNLYCQNPNCRKKITNETTSEDDNEFGLYVPYLKTDAKYWGETIVECPRCKGHMFVVKMVIE